MAPPLLASERLQEEAAEAFALLSGWRVRVHIDGSWFARAFEDAGAAFDAFARLASNGAASLRLDAPDGTCVVAYDGGPR